MHRLHHRYAGAAHADTDQNPHSPEFPKNLFDTMGKTRTYYNDIMNNRDAIPAKFKKGVPNWVWMERFGDRWPVLYHNNHHQYGGRANFGGFRWHEVDPAYPLLKLLNALTVVKLRVGRDEAYM